MSNLIVVEPLPFTPTASRGTGAANLATADPKEVWADEKVGSGAILMLDLGSVRTIDTVFIGYISQAVAASSWTITGGVANGTEQVIQASSPLRVPDAVGTFAARSHALWNGANVDVRYLEITIVQPAGNLPLKCGSIVVGDAFAAALNHEWGAGRRLIDTGSVTSLASGGFAVVEGVRKRAFTWTFGDLSDAEVDRLEAIALARGESATALVVEKPDVSAGLWSRCHYGLFKWRAFERRNKVQTRWEMEIEEWV